MAIHLVLCSSVMKLKNVSLDGKLIFASADKLLAA